LLAARGGSVEALTYLQQHVVLTDASLLSELLNEAASHNQLAAAQWLKEQGAEWPAAFGWASWSDEVLEWARAEGCTAASMYFPNL
jgi:hypothetical protein